MADDTIHELLLKWSDGKEQDIEFRKCIIPKQTDLQSNVGRRSCGPVLRYLDTGHCSALAESIKRCGTLRDGDPYVVVDRGNGVYMHIWTMHACY